MVNEEEEERENPPVKMDSSDSSSFFVAPKQGDVPATKKEKGARGRLRGTAKVVPIRVPDAPSAVPAPVVLDPDDPLNDREPDQPAQRSGL
jgi:hypothetical protein